MNLLLDTHTLIWFLNGDEKSLSSVARQEIETTENIIFVSIASLWEISIKLSLGKISIQNGFKSFLKLIQENEFEILPIEFEDLVIISSLDFFHREPFDRILISQSIANNLLLLTKDKNIQKYPVKTLW